MTSIQPGAVESELYDHITDTGYSESMAKLSKQIPFLKGEDIGNAVAYALQVPDYVNVAELFVLPTAQAW